MLNWNVKPGALVKPMVAVAALSSLAALAGSRIFPDTPLPRLILLSLLGAVVLFVILTAASILTLTLMQFILRKGGTDTQWFWFSAEPPGLVRLRAQAREPKS